MTKMARLSPWGFRHCCHSSKYLHATCFQNAGEISQVKVIRVLILNIFPIQFASFENMEPTL